MIDSKLTPIYVFLGTRAQTIKMAPILRELEIKGIDYDLLYTQQHKVTITDLLSDFKIKTKPINIVERTKEAKTISLFAGWLFQILKITLNPFSGGQLFKKGKGLVLTHGDTATTAWSAFYSRIHGNKVMHIESGLRSYNIFNPFPEEIQRLITFKFSNYYTAPGQWALNNLKKYKGRKINTYANTMYDAFKYGLTTISNSNKNTSIKINNIVLPKNYALVSLHRYENIFNKKQFKLILDLLDKISNLKQLVFIMHPSTETKLKQGGYYEDLVKDKNIILIPRLSFLQFARIAYKADFVITDGGSNQEEMSYIGKPTVLFRSYTERKEGLNKNVLLSKFNEEKIMNFVANYQKYSYPELVLEKSPSSLIIDFVLEVLQETK